MRPHRRQAASLSMLGSVLFAATAATATDIPLRNWSAGAPSTQAPLLTDASGYVMSFMPVTPCRVIDTRGGAPFTGGAFAASTGRDYQFSAAAAPCTGLPAGARGYSINVTVTSTAGDGFLAIYPRNGQPVPLVSTINYVAGQTIANAAVVPTDNAGFISILCGVSGTHVIVDVNGYYIGSDGSLAMSPGVYAGWSGNVSFGSVIYAYNTNTTGTSSFISAIRGVIATPQANGQAALYGQAAASGGLNYGVKGTNTSADGDSAGIYGLSGATPLPSAGYLRAGIRGESTNTYGILGLSTNIGIEGVRVDAGGAFLHGGQLGSFSYGVYSLGDFGGTGAKYFVEPHPEDPTRIIKYVALEGPEAGTYFRGRGRFGDGSARIAVPDSFRFVTDTEGITVQVTPIGKPAAVAVVSADLTEIVVEATKDVEFAFLVQGVRKAFKDFDAIVEGTEFVPERASDTIPAYLTEEARRRLVENGTYNPDGTVNMTTAERVGWAKAWRERDEKARIAAEAAAEASKNDPQISGSHSTASSRR